MTDALDSATAARREIVVSPIPVDFALGLEEGVDDGLRRIAMEQVDLATWHAKRVGEADEHVHEIRRAMKRIRAVLRMVRNIIGEESYRHGNFALRDVARDLSEARSGTIRVVTLEALPEWNAPVAPSVTRLHETLIDDASAVAQSLQPEQLVENLGLARVGLREWTLTPELVPLASGVRRTYRRGRLGMTNAYADRTTDHFHEWRKRVKYLRHQLEVLAAVLPDAMDLVTEGLGELGYGLGLDHDLADLSSAVSGSRSNSLSPADQRDLLTSIGLRRQELQADLRPMAEQLYAQPPRDFASTIKAFWQAQVWNHAR
jgi:CHAD domain-containing protein